MMKKRIYMMIVLLGMAGLAHAQESLINATSVAHKQALTLQQCIDLATKQSYTMQAAEKSIERAKVMQGTAWDVDKTDLTLSQDPTSGGSPDNSISLSQTIEFPTVYVARRQQLKAETQAECSKMGVQKKALIGEVSSLYYQLVYEYQRVKILAQQDSILNLSKLITEKRYQAGETRKLDVLSAEKVWKENLLELATAKSEAENVRVQLAKAINWGADDSQKNANFDIVQTDLSPIDYTQAPYSYQQTVEGAYAQDRLSVADKALKVAKNGYAPSLSLSLRNQLVLTSWDPYNQNRTKFDGGNFMGFEVGVGIPLFYGATKAKVKAAKKEREQTELEIKAEAQAKETEYQTAMSLCNANLARLTYYQQEGDKRAEELSQLGTLEYQNGEISYIEYVNVLQESIDIKMNHANAINDYNQSVIALKQLTGM